MDWPFHVDPLRRLLVDVGVQGPIAALSVHAANLLLARLLSPELRRSVRFSAALAWLYIAISTARCFTPPDTDIDTVFRVLAAISLTFACSQTLFVLIIDFLLGRNGKKPLRPLIRYGLLGITFFVAALVGLRAGGVTTLGVLASGAVVVGGVGAAVAEVLKQVGAGILVQYSRPFEIGDVIQVLPLERRGAVLSTNWRNTAMRTPDGVELLVPNADVVKNTVINFGHGDRAFRRQITFDAAYGTPPDRVRHEVLPALRDVPGLEPSPLPEVLLDEYKDSGVAYVVRYWTRSVHELERIDSDVRMRVWYAFARARLSFPFPVRTLQLETTEKKPEEEAPASITEPLRRSKLFSTVDDAALRDVTLLAREAPFGPGEIVVAAGEVGTTMHVILEGEVAVQGPLDRRELFRLTAGDFFGEMSLVTGALRTATIVTTMPTRTLVIDDRAFQAIVERHPEVLDALSEVISVRQVDLTAALEQKPADSARSRHIKSLIMDRLKGIFRFGGET